jgi:hypothetical protein
MFFLEILSIILISIFIGSIFYYGFKTTGPWGSFWSFLLILFFGMWIADIWVDPYGPVYWGVAWFDILFVGLLLAFLLAAATPSRRAYRNDGLTETEMVEAAKAETGGVAALGVFFWLMMLMFLVIIGIGLVA